MIHYQIMTCEALASRSAGFDNYLTALRNIVIKRITTVWELNVRNKLANDAKHDLVELVNSNKFQGPSVLM